MIKPAQGPVGQEFSDAHLAVDIGGPEYFGTPIVAPYDGVITAAAQMGSGTNDAGLAIDIKSHDGMYLSRLGHNDQILVRVGQTVKAGEQVGTQGYTGYTIPDNQKGGTHCHWVLWVNGVRVNGEDYINEGNDMTDAERQAMEADKQAWMERALKAEGGVAHLDRALKEAYADLEKHKAGEAHLDRTLKEAYLEIDRLKALTNSGAVNKLEEIKRILGV